MISSFVVHKLDRHGQDVESILGVPDHHEVDVLIAQRFRTTTFHGLPCQNTLQYLGILIQHLLFHIAWVIWVPRRKQVLPGAILWPGSCVGEAQIDAQ